MIPAAAPNPALPAAAVTVEDEGIPPAGAKTLSGTDGNEYLLGGAPGVKVASKAYDVMIHRPVDAQTATVVSFLTQNVDSWVGPNVLARNLQTKVIDSEDGTVTLNYVHARLLNPVPDFNDFEAGNPSAIPPTSDTYTVVPLPDASFPITLQGDWERGNVTWQVSSTVAGGRSVKPLTRTLSTGDEDTCNHGLCGHDCGRLHWNLALIPHFFHRRIPFRFYRRYSRQGRI